jgi:hypothetical protein
VSFCESTEDEHQLFVTREKINCLQLKNQLISLKSLEHIELSSIEKISSHLASLMQLSCKMLPRISRLKKNRPIRAIKDNPIPIKKNNRIRIKARIIIRRRMNNSMKDAYAEICILSKNVCTLSRSIESRNEKRINRLEIT